MNPLLNFYIKAYTGARSGSKKLAVLLAAGKANGLADTDYAFLCRFAGVVSKVSG